MDRKTVTGICLLLWSQAELDPFSSREVVTWREFFEMRVMVVVFLGGEGIMFLLYLFSFFFPIRPIIMRARVPQSYPLPRCPVDHSAGCSPCLIDLHVLP